MAEQYSNRSDLRNPMKKMAATAATGQTYGEAGKQMAAQQAVPMGASPTDVGMETPRPKVTPGNVVNLMAPTERPNDLMAPVMNQPMSLPMRDPVVEELEILMQMYPNDDLANLLSVLKFGGQ
jgi:hypothetical protein